jgi:hypothetical protein
VQKFSIEPLPGERDDWGSELALLTIGDFTERIGFDTEYWSIAQYRAQWKKAVSDIISHKKTHTGLFTGLGARKSKTLIWAWTLYREGDTVYIQSRGFDLHYPPEQCDVDNLDQILSPRKKTYDPKERKPSEWSINISALEEWLKHLKNEE